MQTINIEKAQSVAGLPSLSITIIIDEEIKSAKDLAEVSRIFNQQAETLESALHNSLPGGTYSALLEKMLRRRASHFVVSYGS